ncbi:eukaryotic membrane protein family-domain-containing protein [Paraphoma chrysanthemicola]|uniref:Eukaryotic membrane protein family-domain-containing protein n=1 Tax=Paraphoma chrysanthemicola TaxID=798071 RepID=A0A8K0W2B2_9PLEO|nr:eukaryotic membrane protein family-domain-containing protein [Paraphoma chrysanthemicola]
MNGGDTRTHGERYVTEQLPTPARSPEPDDVAFPASHRSNDAKPGRLLQDMTNIPKADTNGSLSASSTSRRTSIHEDAILSDTSEKIRPIKRPGDVRRKSSVSEHDKILKLSPRQIQELTNEPTSIPIRAATPIQEESPGALADVEGDSRVLGVVLERPVEANGTKGGEKNSKVPRDGRPETEVVVIKTPATDFRQGRPVLTSRSATTPLVVRRRQSSSRSRQTGQTHDGEDRRSTRHVLPPLSTEHKDGPFKPVPQDRRKERDIRDLFSPTRIALPLPPMSMPTFLSLELSANRPSPLYIYRPATDDFPYESSELKYQRLINFMKIPAKIEGILAFGALACLDAWMHTLTILPLRFLLAIGILVKWWASVLIKEARDIWAFVYSGLPRVWRRRRQTDAAAVPPTPAEEEPPSISRRTSSNATATTTAKPGGDISTTFRFPDFKDVRPRRTRNSRFRHRRTKSTPSALLPGHKADILKGLLIVFSCFVLMRFDASRMYHGIRGQSAIKLYVIYNLLEVCDRLLSAIGQDVLECLFSRETLDRDADGRSKVLRPFGMFILASVYTVAHATALFYQVITLNVAVNSYSNALLTLLMSNQFVEIKGTVFKKFEKENLFQITCADVVERFQLWLMLLIIAMRNVVEVGGLSIRSSGTSWTDMFTSTNATTSASAAAFTASSIMPMSFTIFPKYIAQVLNPFLLVIGSEMVVDWLKHAYITKFNQYKPDVYGKFFDIFAKDYYSNAFSDQNLTRRLGLPVIPLSCLFIRAAIQTYHMFVAMHMPPPLPATSTSLTSDPESSPATTAALAHIDQVFRRALGRSSFGAGLPSQSWYHLSSWSLDDLIAGSTMLIVFLVIYLIFLAFKLILGMLLLIVARRRYHGMQEREMRSVETGGKRIGGWGVVDVDEEKRKHIYDDDPETLKRLRERDEKAKKKEEQERERGTSFGHVSRYAMVAKRIW